MAGKKMVSTRLEEMTLEQLKTMQYEYGYRQTALIQIAVNFLYNEALKRKGEEIEDQKFMSKQSIGFIEDLINYPVN